MKTIILCLFCSFLLLTETSAFFDPSVRSDQELLSYVDTLNDALGFEALQAFDFNEVMSLVRQLGQLDRYNLTPQEFFANLKAATSLREQFSFDDRGLTQQEFEQYLLPLRIRYESTARSTWMPFFNQIFLPLIKDKSVEDAAEEIFDHIKSRVRCSTETTYVLPYRGDLDPLTTWKGKQGDEIDVSILACAALRSVGIPSRLVYTPQIRKSNGGKVWLEFMNEHKTWIPWVPTFSEKLATQDHLPALKLFLKNRCGVIFANPPHPIEITGHYAEIQRVRFAPTNDPKRKLEYNIAFEVDSLLKPIRGYELISIPTTMTERSQASTDYWTFIVQDDLNVLGVKHDESSQVK